MRYRLWVFVLLGLTSVALLINACKKDNSDTVSYFLTEGTWQLASVQRTTYLGDTKLLTETLDSLCTLNQTFKFTSDNACTYTNYHCITQSSTGKWLITPDNLTLQTTLSAQDTLKGAIVNVKAFDNAQIVNLGQYSMVLNTGYTSSYYTSKTPRVIVRYGFVHPSNQ
jgi:hypothetical protein